MISAPKVDERPERLYMGIRTIAPFRGMFAEVDKLLKELRKWVNTHDIAEEGPFFLPYHVIDMDGPMDIGLGFVVAEQLPGDEREKPGYCRQDDTPASSIPAVACKGIKH